MILGIAASSSAMALSMGRNLRAWIAPAATPQTDGRQVCEEMRDDNTREV